MGWTGWKLGGPEIWAGFLVNVYVDDEHRWVHYLVAPLDEQAPDDNHIHLKNSYDDEWVVAAVKVDGIDVINRRKLIEAINRRTGLDLHYR